MPNLDEILAIILGGGRGSRLYPLTKVRAKPAVPMAGQYRLIDIPISNCINSRIYRIAVLTQFSSISLHRHISRTYQFDAFHSGWVQVWAAEQTMQSADWYQGTADAVRKQLFEIKASRAKYVLILAGDHLYRMDFANMAQFHWDHHADISVAVQPVLAREAGRYGILKRNQTLKISDFAEKPKDPDLLKYMVSREDPDKPYLGSMGIYFFNTEALLDLLADRSLDDFGKDIIPHAIESHAVYGYDFEGFWEDIGTIRSFFETNLALACPDTPFNMFDPEYPIYTHPRFLPGSTVEDSQLHHVLLADGCCIQQAQIHHSVIGLRSQIARGVYIADSILMGNDYYDSPDRLARTGVAMGIGPGSHVEGAIIDKNARVGANTTILPFPRGTDIDTDTWVVRDGIVVVPKGAILPDGTRIAPGSSD